MYSIFSSFSSSHFSRIYTPMMKMLQTDVAIIGAGPVGLFAVFECGMLGLSCHVFDSLDQIGGQCTALYPEKPIYDIPAYPKIEAAQLIAELEAQAAPFAPTYHLGQQITGLDKFSGIWTLTTSTGQALTAKAVVIAGGSGSFGPHRPPLEGLAAYEGISVFYSVRRKSDFAGKRIVIAGGGDSAVDWGLSLSEVADLIYLVHRRETFRAAPASLHLLQRRVESGKIRLVTPYQLHAIEGQDGRLTAVHVSNLDAEVQILQADCLLPFFGLSANLGPILEWGLSLEHHQIPVEQGTGATNLFGVYACGDIATYPHKLKLILTGFAEAAQVAHAIYRQIHPATPLHMEYSTTRGVAALK